MSISFLRIDTFRFKLLLFLQKHNKYVASKLANLEKEDEDAFYELVVNRLNELQLENKRNREFSWR